MILAIRAEIARFQDVAQGMTAWDDELDLKDSDTREPL